MMYNPMVCVTTTEFIINAITFTAGLLQAVGYAHHPRFVLRTVGEYRSHYNCRLVTQTIIDSPLSSPVRVTNRR
jgi:hypothetical protein